MKVSLLIWTILLSFAYSKNMQTCIDGLLNDLPCSSFHRCFGKIKSLNLHAHYMNPIVLILYIKILIDNNAKENPNVILNNLSNGNGQSQSMSEVYFCYDDNYFVLQFISFNQSKYSQTAFEDCNDSVYNLDVVESFISTWELNKNSSDGPYCYSEIDLSPFNKIYQAGIYNKNLNHTGITNFPLDCATSGIRSRADVNPTNPSIWTTKIEIPWSVIVNPNGCPIATSSYHKETENTVVAIPNALRANFYRVNELSVSDGSKCSSSSCEYMAWSPTLSNPPAFHEPTKFGYLIRVD